MESRVWLSSAVLLFALVGCDDELGAPGKCRSFAREICEALVECGLAEETDMRECRDDMEAEAACDDAVGVARSYSACLDDISERRQCAAWPALPESCEEVILIE